MSFVATYHPKLKDFVQLIKNVQLFLYCDSEVRSVFSPAPIVSYQSARQIQDYIVRSKLYPVEKKLVSYRFGQVRARYQVRDHKINHKFNCSSKCLIYLLSCKTCGKQYTGETVDKFRSN